MRLYTTEDKKAVVTFGMLVRRHVSSNLTGHSLCSLGMLLEDCWSTNQEHHNCDSLMHLRSLVTTKRKNDDTVSAIWSTKHFLTEYELLPNFRIPAVDKAVAFSHLSIGQWELRLTVRTMYHIIVLCPLSINNSLAKHLNAETNRIKWPYGLDRRSQMKLQSEHDKRLLLETTLKSPNQTNH